MMTSQLNKTTLDYESLLAHSDGLAQENQTRVAELKVIWKIMSYEELLSGCDWVAEISLVWIINY